MVIGQTCMAAGLLHHILVNGFKLMAFTARGTAHSVMVLCVHVSVFLFMSVFL